ncbi:GTF3A [Cordylochernes scorpioides]|uniref:GTF3A n=1 Tax=Cordylochernes scorpioides TaxID=51811 RepID=A0ABY6KA81_9ARAC|nr:GTF3A [Cordylochernes scorpioides]
MADSSHQPVYNTKITTKEAGKVMETCKYCGKQLEYKSQLIDHEKTHTGEREFMCDRKGCNFRSHRNFNVTQHKITHTEEKPFKCYRCNYRSTQKSHLRVHIRKHTNSKPYICDLCGFQTSYSGSLNRHKRNKHTDPALKCKLCKYVARGKADLRSHACKESLCCGECGYRTQSRSQFISHQEVHNTVPYSCSSVELGVELRHNASYYSGLAMQPHMSTTPALERRVPGKVMETCKYCDYQTQNMGLLKVHEKTHTGEKEFRCDWKGCNYRSNQKYCVKQHKFTHTKEKPFSCEHCNYTSALKVYMKIHVQKHISKPYICDKCNFETSYCNSLKRHKRYKHTDPALKCKLCKYVASGEADLRIHACNKSLCCGEFGYKTHIKLNFTRHQEVHNSLLYSCSLCGKKSKSKPYFTKHMKDKHKIQKFNIEEYVTPATTSSDK